MHDLPSQWLLFNIEVINTITIVNKALNHRWYSKTTLLAIYDLTKLSYFAHINMHQLNVWAVNEYGVLICMAMLQTFL